MFVCAAAVVNCVVLEVIVNKCVGIAGGVLLVICGNGESIWHYRCGKNSK